MFVVFFLYGTGDGVLHFGRAELFFFRVDLSILRGFVRERADLQSGFVRVVFVRLCILGTCVGASWRLFEGVLRFRVFMLDVGGEHELNLERRSFRVISRPFPSSISS